MEKIRVHVFVSGLVQGVFFRATTADVAKKLGSITGWVKNLPDGRVEVLAEGPRETVLNLIKWLHTGPPASAVSDVALSWEKATGEFKSFAVHN
ncbi:Acylphosphate phosphohydrolase, putative [hydrothermal vent metagenome]|uniref:Acylphosphate phosphohydrolase, putative n=1 Tax=hydrothermal vent metagenome TaxID=652676 RepID=A0A3B1C0Z2_9ZZZZ